MLASTPPKARPNRLKTRQGEKTARWCTWAYIEGESLMPNAVSSDLVRFEESHDNRLRYQNPTRQIGESRTSGTSRS